MSPLLVVVSGHAGTGKTTLAHRLAAVIGCPAICRDEIKEGMAAGSGFTGAPGDQLTWRTLPVFFSAIELLLRAGVTVVAEAAFQDQVWRPRLEPLQALAEVRIIRCATPAPAAYARAVRRSDDDPVRRVHAHPWPDLAAFAREQAAFRAVELGVPALDVDTSDGYRPGLAAIARFALSKRQPASGT